MAMIAKDLISDSISTLHTSDTAIYALSLMEEYRVSHLPIVNNEEFLGLVSESDLYEFADPEAALGAHALSLSKPYVLSNQHVYELIKLADEQKLSLIPVLDDRNTYLGVILLIDLVHYFAKLTAVNQPGGIITLEMNVHDYSQAEIAQIVEYNDAKEKFNQVNNALQILENKITKTFSESQIKLQKETERSLEALEKKIDNLSRTTHKERTKLKELIDSTDESLQDQLSNQKDEFTVKLKIMKENTSDEHKKIAESIEAMKIELTETLQTKLTTLSDDKLSRDTMAQMLLDVAMKIQGTDMSTLITEDKKSDK